MRETERTGREREEATARRRARRRAYYEAHRYEICRRRLEQDCYRSMEEIGARLAARVQSYYAAYPFETYAERRIAAELHRRGLRRHDVAYMDGYDAGMLAYMYSIHRCAALACDYAPQYIVKMIRILVCCALVVANETRHICRENGLVELRLDREDVPRLR